MQTTPRTCMGSDTVMASMVSLRCLKTRGVFVQEKIWIIAEKMYGAGKVEYSERAEADIERYTRQGFDKLPICMAKTQYSFSGEAENKGAPSGFTLHIREARHPSFPCLCLMLRPHMNQSHALSDNHWWSSQGFHGTFPFFL